MLTHQDKSAADVLDYQPSHQPETELERWLFRLAIGLNLVYGACWFFMVFDYYEAFRLFTGMKTLILKITRGVPYILPPLGIGLTIIGLYMRTRSGYWLAGCWAGYMLSLLIVYIPYVFYYVGLEFLVIPEVLILELFFPLLIIICFSYFLTRDLVMVRLRVRRGAFSLSLASGFILGVAILVLVLGFGG